MTVTQYYYRRLPPVQQEVYRRLLTGFREITPSIRIPRLPGEALSTLFFQLRLDHPEIFYVVGYSCRAALGADSVEFVPEYMFSKGRIREQQKALEARVARLIRPVQGKTDAEKEAYLHDFILTQVRYDKLKKPYSHEVIGPLTNGVGVCEGIAKTVKLLCDALDMECIIAISDCDRANGERYLHAWNVIRLGRNYYHLDATFDNTLCKYGGLRYDYYNLDDAKIFRDHRPLLYPVPPCTDGEQFYYRVNHLSWTKYEDVQKHAEQALRKKRERLIFHWRGGYLTREMLAELCRILTDTAAAHGRGAAISVNWPQAVLQVAFTDTEAPAAVTTESAEEPEMGKTETVC